LAGATKSSRISEQRKKRSGHVVVRCIKNCFIEARGGAVLVLSREEGFVFGLFKTFATSMPFGA
jgi:hypothetical protein